MYAHRHTRLPANVFHSLEIMNTFYLISYKLNGDMKLWASEQMSTPARLPSKNSTKTGNTVQSLYTFLLCEVLTYLIACLFIWETVKNIKKQETEPVTITNELITLY